MIQMRTMLQAADNSGAKSLMCIKVLGGSKRRYATVGDVIKVSVRDAIPRARTSEMVSARNGSAVVVAAVNTPCPVSMTARRNASPAGWPFPRSQ